MSTFRLCSAWFRESIIAFFFGWPSLYILEENKHMKIWYLKLNKWWKHIFIQFAQNKIYKLNKVKEKKFIIRRSWADVLNKINIIIWKRENVLSTCFVKCEKINSNQEDKTAKTLLLIEWISRSRMQNYQWTDKATIPRCAFKKWKREYAILVIFCTHFLLE